MCLNQLPLSHNTTEQLYENVFPVYLFSIYLFSILQAFPLYKAYMLFFHNPSLGKE